MNPAQMVSRFYDARDGLKAISGEKYEDRIATPMRLVREAMVKHKCSSVRAFIIICKENKLEGWETVVFMAAVCEIEEFLARCHNRRAQKQRKTMNCPKCGDIDCPGAVGCACRVVRPMLSKFEFIGRLTEAGWKPHEAEEAWQSIQEDQESGE